MPASRVASIAGVIAATAPGGVPVSVPLTPDLTGADGPLAPPWFTGSCLPQLQLVSHSLQTVGSVLTQSGFLLTSSDFDLTFTVAYSASMAGARDDVQVAFHASPCFFDAEHYLFATNPGVGGTSFGSLDQALNNTSFPVIVNGSGTGTIAEGSTHTWRLVVVNNTFAAYLDGAPHIPSTAIDPLSGRTLWFTLNKPGTAISGITLAAVGYATKDSFDRANTASTLGTPDVGAAWSVLTSGATFGITSNTAYLSSTTGQASVVSNSGIAIGTFACDVTLSAIRSDCGIVFNAADDNNYLLAVLAVGSTQNATRLYKRVGGTFTQLGTDLGAGVPLGATVRLTVVRTASTVKMYVGTTLAQSYTLTAGEQTAFNSNTKHGIRVNYVASGPTGDDGGTRFDNYVVTS